MQANKNTLKTTTGSYLYLVFSTGEWMEIPLLLWMHQMRKCTNVIAI